MEEKCRHRSCCQLAGWTAEYWRLGQSQNIKQVYNYQSCSKTCLKLKKSIIRAGGRGCNVVLSTRGNRFASKLEARIEVRNSGALCKKLLLQARPRGGTGPHLKMGGYSYERARALHPVAALELPVAQLCPALPSFVQVCPALRLGAYSVEIISRAEGAT